MKDTRSAQHEVPPLNGEVKKQYDPFDPESLRIDAMTDIEVETVMTTVPVRKPDRREFIRVHSDPAYALDTLVLERDTGMDKETYLVTPEIQERVLPELRRVRLFVTMTRKGVVLLWPIKLAGDNDNRMRRISDTALQAAEHAKSHWVRVEWNFDLGGYELRRAKADLGEPQWPDKTLRDLIELAFRKNVIDRADHPVIRELEGEI
jgi:hypothetical protein